MYEDQLRSAIVTIRTLKAELRKAQAKHNGPIAIVGMGCRFPGGANSPEAYAHMLMDSVDAVGEVPSDRWDNDIWYDHDPDVPGKMNSRWGAFLEGIDRFDAEFFDLSDREAIEMDPQHRMLLEVSWEALERAAIAPDSLSGSRTGVFVGINGDEYYQQGIADPGAIDAHTISGGVASVAAGRIAYQLGLNGPAVALDTACSSSLAAVHQACQSLRSGETDLALAGGVYVVLEPNLSVGLSKLHMMAQDGRCKSFDSRADGFVQGEGAGIVVLKRLDDALAAGDPVISVIRGTAMNQDGRSVSLTAPSRIAQKRVIEDALRDAGVNPSDIGYIETHGTGTALGDPIECHALADVFAADRHNPLMLGAVKSNIGHLGPAAGIAGLIKAAQIVQSGQVPPNIHFERINPEISTGKLELDFPLSQRAFPENHDRRIAGVSSFGFSGTNVHLVLEDQRVAQAAAPSEVPRTNDNPSALVLSARTPSGLREIMNKMDQVLQEEQDFARVCRSAALGRCAFEYRIAVVTQSCSEARLALKQTSFAHVIPRPRLAFDISGAGDIDLSRLKAAGIQPYALLGEPGTPVPAGLPVGLPLIHTHEGNDLKKSLEKIGVGVVVAVQKPTYGTADLNVVCTPLRTEKDWLHLYARLYELGFHVNWQAVLPAGPRMALPVTPFHKKRFWRQQRARVNAPSGLPGTLIAGPLPGHQFHLMSGLTRHPWLADHMVHGSVLVPGAFQIACLLLAAEKSGHSDTVIDGIVFPNPLRLPDNADFSIWTKIEPDNQASLVSEGPDGQWVIHAQADLVSGHEDPVKIDVPAIAKRCEEAIDGADWRSELARLGIDVGPAFSGLVEMRRGRGEALAKVEPVNERKLLDGMIHPAFLDACLQAAGGALPEEMRGKTLLPIGIDRFAIRSVPTGTACVHARLKQAGTVVVVDLDVADEAGDVFIQVKGLNAHTASEQDLRKDPLDGLYYQLEWHEQVAKATAQSPNVLVVASTMEDAAVLAQTVGQSTQIAVAGDRLEREVTGVWRYLDNDIEGLIDRCGPVSHIVDCYNSARDHDIGPRAMKFAAFAAGLEMPPGISFGVFGPQSNPEMALLDGLAATLALEQPLTGARYIVADTPAALMAEIAQPCDEDRVCIEKGTRRVTRLTQHPMPTGSTLSDLNGSALVTGGFGAVGRTLARWLLGRGAKAVVLVGRHPDMDFVAELARETGKTVKAVAADMSDAASCDKIQSSFDDLPPLRAVYHAAGAQAAGPLAALSDAQFNTAYGAKARGALSLDASTRENNLDEFVVISSIASVLGAAGQGGYAAANSVLDALIRRRCKDGLPGLSIILGQLDGAGMAGALDASARARLAALGMTALSMDVVLEAIERALKSDLVDPMIAAIDWQAFAARHPAGQLGPSLAHLAGENHPTDEVTGSLEQMVFAEIRLVAGFGAGRILAHDRTLVQLGFDSLMGMELRNRLRRKFGQSPSIATILGGGTLAELLQTFENDASRDDEWEDLVL